MRYLSHFLLPILFLATATPVEAACCYFSAKDKDIAQPSQKVFITWDPVQNVETFTVQPKFEGNALDFGMVIPTPSQPKLDEMPKDFFKALALFTILKQREYPTSILLFGAGMRGWGGLGGGGLGGFGGGGLGGFMPERRPTVKVLEAGVVGTLDYKIITAERADDLFTWLKDNNYSYGGDEATLDFYVKKKWFFTVMKIDTMQMKKKADGSFVGEVTPTRFQFASERLVYPLRITRISVKDKTEALFYVQSPYKVDLPGDMTYQYQWVPMLQNARGWFDKGTPGGSDLPGGGSAWLNSIRDQTPKLLERGRLVGFEFTNGQRPEPNTQGRIATTLEWAKRLDLKDVQILRGLAPYSEQPPDPDEGFTTRDVRDPNKREQTIATIQARLEKLHKARPGGYLTREAPAEEVKQLRILVGHLQSGQFLTKFRKTFTKDEMQDDLLIVPAQLGKTVDRSEYEEILPTSPP